MRMNTMLMQVQISAIEQHETQAIPDCALKKNRTMTSSQQGKQCSAWCSQKLKRVIFQHAESTGL